MSKKTKKAYEEHLNKTYEGCYNWDDVKDNFSHMTNEAALHRHFTNGTLGTLSRQKDPIAFQSGFNTWRIG